MGSSLLTVLRYVVFGLFIVCNAIVASVAVWNRSLGQAIGWESQIDIYLAFLGCLGLAHIFTIIFVELAYRHSITGRVWFECLWLGLFWMMYLAGASAVTAIAPARMCELQFPIRLDETCSSTHLLVVFTWIMTGTLLFYFSLLVFASLLHLHHDSRIFQRYVHKFPWGELRRSMPHPPTPPVLPRFLTKMPSIVAPKPRRPPPVAIYNHHGGLGSAYEIESYATPKLTDSPPPTFAPPLGLLSMTHRAPDAAYQSQEPTALSFYPQHVQSAITPAVTPQPALDRTQAQPVRSPSTQRQLRLHQPPSEPPPLGNWPRSIHTLPPARRRKSTLPKPPMQTPNISHPQAVPISHPRPLPHISLTTTPSPPEVAVTVSRNTSFPPRARPSGPRRRSDGEARILVPELSLGRNATSYQPSS